MSRVIQRGQFIVFEGIDRCGKSTQCENLKRAFEKEGKKVIIQRFPDRKTPSGTMIDSYLKQKANYCDEFIHLLFSANRWECIQNLKTALLSGTTVIVDRYAFSGVAYSSAKGTLSFKWCQAPDIGLVKPDCIFFLDIDPLIASQRANAEKECYDRVEFQQKVLEQFMKMKDDSWKIIDANQSKEKISTDIYNHALSINNQTLEKLWSTDS